MQKRFLEMNNIKDVCEVLDITEKQLNYILYVRDNNYTVFSIKKKNRGI